jgi:hypothetical protein
LLGLFLFLSQSVVLSSSVGSLLSCFLERLTILILFSFLFCFILSFSLGIVASTNRKYDGVQIWNEPGVTVNFNSAGAISDDTSASSNSTRRGSLMDARSSGFFPAVVAVVRSSQTVQKRIYELAHNIEVITLRWFAFLFLTSLFFYE